MKTANIYLFLFVTTLFFTFGCQSESSVIVEKANKKTAPFHLDIKLPSTSIDTLLQPNIDVAKNDIYLKTSTDSLGKSTYSLSVNKQLVSFDAFNDLFDSLRFSIEPSKRNKQIANFYIDHKTPYFLVDYLHKKIISYRQHKIGYYNNKGQYFLHRIPYHEQPIWSSKYPYKYPPPPPPPPQRRNPESDTPIFSEKYLATLNRFGINQKHIPPTGPEFSETYTMNPSNVLEVKLMANNQLSINDTVFTLPEVIQKWQSFMADKKSWNKRIVFLVISGQADYGHYFETYSTILFAFEQKRNQLAIDLFGKHLNALTKEQKRSIYNKLPRMIIPELVD